MANEGKNGGKDQERGGSKDKEPVDQVVWEGCGDAVVKAISCAEILKKNHGTPLHQVTRITSKTIIETWKPRVEGLDDLRVKREIPFICILLSESSLDPGLVGYQAPEDKMGLFNRPAQGPKKQFSKNGHRSKNPLLSTPPASDKTLLASTVRKKQRDLKDRQERRRKREATQGKGRVEAKEKTDKGVASNEGARSEQVEKIVLGTQQQQQQQQQQQKKKSPVKGITSMEGDNG